MSIDSESVNDIVYMLIEIFKRLKEKRPLYLLQRNRHNIDSEVDQEKLFVHRRFNQLITKFQTSPNSFIDCCSNLNEVEETGFLTYQYFLTKTIEEISP